MTNEEAIEICRNIMPHRGTPVFEALDMAIEALKRRPTGKWIDIGDEGLVFKCSLCGYKKTIESHYCPNCGAEMEKEDDNRKGD